MLKKGIVFIEHLIFPTLHKIWQEKKIIRQENTGFRRGIFLVAHFHMKGIVPQISMFPLRRFVKTKLWTKTGHADITHVATFLGAARFSYRARQSTVLFGTTCSSQKIGGVKEAWKNVMKTTTLESNLISRTHSSWLLLLVGCRRLNSAADAAVEPRFLQSIDT